MEKEVLESILDACPYEIVFCNREHVIEYLNATAKQHYQNRIHIGEQFLERADKGETEMFEAYNPIKKEREFFVPVRNNDGKVIGYYERHEVLWSEDNPQEPVGEYWKRGK